MEICQTRFGVFPFFIIYDMKKLLTLLLILSATLCYAQQHNAFTATEIPDSVWARMQGKTYKENPYIGRSDLRYLRLLHWDYDGKTHQGEMVCNKLIADRVVEIFRLLYEAHYPIERMVLPDEYDADDERQI